MAQGFIAVNGLLVLMSSFFLSRCQVRAKIWESCAQDRRRRDVDHPFRAMIGPIAS